MMRRPLALSNWKMAMTVAESLAFVRDFEAIAGDLLDIVDVVICPSYTALWPVAQALRDSRVQLGGQNIAPTADGSTELAEVLLACPDVDGLGATRRGRDAATFVQIVRLIAQTRTP